MLIQVPAYEYDLVQPWLDRLPRLSRPSFKRHVDAVKHIPARIVLKIENALDSEQVLACHLNKPIKPGVKGNWINCSRRAYRNTSYALVVPLFVIGENTWIDRQDIFEIKRPYIQHRRTIDDAGLCPYDFGQRVKVPQSSFRLADNIFNFKVNLVEKEYISKADLLSRLLQVELLGDVFCIHNRDDCVELKTLCENFIEHERLDNWPRISKT